MTTKTRSRSKSIAVRNSDPPAVKVAADGRITAGYETIPLRLRKGLGVAMSISVAPVGPQWFAGVSCERVGHPQRDVDECPLSTRNAPHASWDAAIEAALRDLAEWSARHSGIGSVKHRKVIEDVAKHGRQLLGRAITSKPAASDLPETQAEAAAKEHAAAATPAETIEIPIGLVDENPRNARLRFDGIEQLAAKLQQEGQLQECVGRRRGKRVELIAGSRRYRAAKIAGLKTLRVRIVDVGDIEALLMMGSENEDREDFDPISRATWYQALLDAKGCSQRELAELLGVGQATVANHVQLLKLPEAWRERLITREITETHARALLPFADSPGAMKALEGAWKSLKGLAVDGFADAVMRTISRAGAPCRKGAYYHLCHGKKWRSGHVLFTPALLEKHREELDVVTVKEWGNIEPIAMNVKRWVELHGNLEAEATKRAEAKGKPGKGAKGDQAKGKTPAELQKLRKEQQEQLEKRVRHYAYAWIQQRVADAIRECEDEFLLRRMLVWFCLLSGGRGRAKMAEDVADLHPKSRGRRDSWWEALGEEFDEREMLATWLQHNLDDFNCPYTREEIADIAGSLKIDISKQWRVDQEFLEIFNLAQMESLSKEWKMMWQGGKKATCIECLLRNDQNHRLPVPKILAKALK